MHRPRILAALACVGIALVATFPGVLTLGTRLIGNEDVDNWNHAWGPWWYWTSISAGELPWRTLLIGAPKGGILWFIDPIGAVLGAPLVPLFGSVFAYNAVIMTYVAVAAAGARSLARAFGATDAHSWLAAVAVAASPYVLSEVSNGVSEAVNVGPGLFALAAAWRALSEDALPPYDVPRASHRRFVIAGIWLGITAIGTYYYAFAAGLVVATWFVAKGRALMSRPVWVGGVILALVSASVAAGPLGLMLASTSASEALVHRGAPSAADLGLLLRHNAVDPRTFLAPGDFQSVDLTARGEAFRHSSYLGWIALALALASRRTWALVGAIPVVVFSLGRWLWWGSDWAHAAPGQVISLPLGWFGTALPALFTHAQRLGAPAIGIVAAAAAVGVARVGRYWPAAVLAVGLDGLLVGPSPWPIPRSPALDLSAHAALADAPPVVCGDRTGNIVLDLPGELGATMATSRYFLYQTAHGRPVPWSPDARSGTSSLLSISPVGVLFRASAATRAEATGRGAWASGGWPPSIDTGELCRAGVGWIVLHRELERGHQGTEWLTATLTDWLGRPTELGSHLTWTTVSNGGRKQVHPPLSAAGPP